MKEKERELEKVEDQACALVQNKTDEACAVVMESLQALNNTWANLDHLVLLFISFVFHFNSTIISCCLRVWLK